MVSSEVRGNVFLVHLVGNLEISDSQTLEEMVRNAMTKGYRFFVLDFSEVVYLNSSGARVLLVIERELGRVGGRMILAALNDTVRRTLGIIGLDRVFTIVNDKEEALRLMGL